MKSKGTATIICFFLGGLGVHKFYLGQTGAGIVYLLLSWTFVPSIIAFVEFFILLLMSDEDFNRQYNNGISGSGYSGGAISAQDATRALGDLKKLFESGVITAEEYEEKRQKLLKSL
ncbi:NINE protein [Calothrix sp. PCC 6303]|uniref:NINE protein n=1 Tax=Calothrix sp. PCC 6303 TaxID=1170562 RepID=UPI0002A059FC|nr:NINE protein [Calothrix sp. PCC 6303]AFZ02156.1 TM2 domain-containing protein [Calothrix sp. PCC 6303]